MKVSECKEIVHRCFFGATKYTGSDVQWTEGLHLAKLIILEDDIKKLWTDAEGEESTNTLPQDAIDAMKSIYDRNRARGTVEVNLPSIPEREAATALSIAGRAEENARLRNHNQAVADERDERNGSTPLP